MFRNSFNFTTLVLSEDTIRIVYEMRLCADILSGNLPDTIRRTLSSELRPTIVLISFDDSTQSISLQLLFMGSPINHPVIPFLSLHLLNLKVLMQMEAATSPLI
jgi:hypothetical protein